MTLRSLGLGATLVAVVILLGSLVLGLRQPAEAVAGSEVISAPAPRERVRVEVLNAAGVSGLARRVTDRLRAAGFDVVYYGNASRDLIRDSTTILDRSGNSEAIRALSAELEVERIETAVDTMLYLEATLVLAKDWEDAE